MNSYDTQHYYYVFKTITKKKIIMLSIYGIMLFDVATHRYMSNKTVCEAVFCQYP